MIKKIDHMVITTENIEKCLEFYEILGFKAKRGEGRHELYAGDFKINIHIKGSELLPRARNVRVGSADFCLEVQNGTDMESLKNLLCDKGLEIELGVVERTGVQGRMKSIYLRDPDGNLVELSNYS